MKKFYFVAMAVCAFAFSSNAQIVDDTFEFYNLGDMGNQALGVWRTWSGNIGVGEDIVVVDDTTIDDKSGYIGDNNVQDAVLELGNITGAGSGQYGLAFMMYIPSNASGYFNIQGELPAGPISGVFNSSDIYFNELGTTPGQGEDTTPGGDTFTFPEDTWFMVRIDFDLDPGVPTYVLYVDGVQVNASPIPFNTDVTLGGIDFYSISSNNEYWIDNVLFQEGYILNNNDFEASSFSVYPNPVKDVLNISTTSTVESVVVYDVLGKVVLQAQPDAISPSVDMGALASGAYMVKVTIDGISKTVKVVK